MTEVGLLPFARIAPQVSKAALPRYRSRFRQAPIYTAPVAGDPLSHALRGLDLSRNRNAAPLGNICTTTG